MSRLNQYLEMFKAKQKKPTATTLLSNYRGKQDHKNIEAYLKQHGVTNYKSAGSESFNIDGEWSTLYKFTADFKGEKIYGAFDVEFAIADTDTKPINAKDYKY